MQTGNIKRKFRWLKAVAIIYVAGGMALYLLQDRILFHPVSLKRTHQYNFPDKHNEINIPLNENSNLNIVQFLSTDSVTKGVVLYFHGNKKNIGWYAKFPPYFTRHGYEVWMIDYPGFGKSTGKFSEKTLYSWAGVLYDFARSRFNEDSIIIYGKSMGTGIATELASRKACKELILETPYHDFPSVIKQYLPIYPVEWMLHYKIPTYQYIQQVKSPITILQGTNDWLVTYRNASGLKKYLKPGDNFVTIEGGSHNDLYKYKTMINKLDSLLSN